MLLTAWQRVRDLTLIRRLTRGRNHGRMPENSDGSRDLPLSRLPDAVICRVQSTGQPTGRSRGRLRRLIEPVPVITCPDRFALANPPLPRNRSSTMAYRRAHDLMWSTRRFRHADRQYRLRGKSPQAPKSRSHVAGGAHIRYPPPSARTPQRGRHRG